MLQQTISDLVTQRTSRAEVFDKYDLDYYQLGSRTLEDTCLQNDLDPQQILKQLQEHDRIHQIDAETDWSKTTLRELINHIVSFHHNRLREALPKLSDLVSEVAQRYGEQHPGLNELEKIFGAFRFSLEAHLLSEEKILFKTILELESGHIHWQGELGVNEQIRIRFREHDSSGADIRMMRKITNNFTAPHDAGESYQRLMSELAMLEHDIHLHLHKENNILFARASMLAVEHIRAGASH